MGQLFTSHGPSDPDGLGCVWVLNTLAEPEMLLRGASLTNVAFGGAGRKQLLCTDSTHGTVLMCDMLVAGQAVPMGVLSA